MKIYSALTFVAALASTLTVNGLELQVSTGARGTHSCGWMAANSTVGAAFQGYWIGGLYHEGVPEGTCVYTWNETTQAWNLTTYEFGEWDNASFALTTARGFLLENPEWDPVVYKLTFQPFTGSEVIIHLTADKWYYLSRPWPNTWGNYNRGFLEISDVPYYNTLYPNFNWFQEVGNRDTLYYWAGGWGFYAESIGTEFVPHRWSGGNGGVLFLEGWQNGPSVYSFDGAGFSSFMLQNSRGSDFSWTNKLVTVN